MQNQDNSNKNSQPRSTPPNMFNFLLVGFLITIILNMFFSSWGNDKNTEVAYSQFVEMVEAGQVDKAKLEPTQIIFTIRDTTTATKSTGETNEAIFERNLEQLTQQIQNHQAYYTSRSHNAIIDSLYANNVWVYEAVPQNNELLDFFSRWIMPILWLYVIYFFVIRYLLKKVGGDGGLGGMMNVGKSNAKVYNLEKKTGITFHDVAGQQEAKESLSEMVDFLNHPEKYQKIGAKQPKGALLVGPPGTGKTLLAKAVAGEAGVPFFSLTGSEFVEMFVGVGAKRVRDLFEQAKKQAPCIIFIDEIDAIGKSRDNQMSSNDEREQTLNQLLAEMDGFDGSKGIVIFAATNRPEILDKALLRPGRFDRQVIVEKPDKPGREDILRVHAKKVAMGPDVDLAEIALATSGATGADLANMINEAALRAVRIGRQAVIQEDLMESVEVVIAGKEKKDRILGAKEKEMVAYHEVGHALASALQKNAQPVQKITIVPRTMGALGYTMNMPEEERFLMTKDELLAQIVILLAGRAAEEVQFGSASTGASNDIERATKMARAMVTQYGMSEQFGMMGLESTQSKYLDGRNISTVSDVTGAKADEEVRKILNECHQKATELLEKNKEKLAEISRFLIEKESITGQQFMQLLNSADAEPIMQSDEITEE